ncbi:MAG: hypothetical protein HQL37_15755 [Alphaproteobacteria bacterium]|nr:hypothetical protein [Alphaproteobacteria bacterium]
MNQDSNRLSVTDAALRLGVSVDTVRRRLKNHEIEGQRDNTGKGWVFIPANTETEAGVPPQPKPPSFQPQSAPRSDLLDHLLRENERLWETLRDRDGLIRELIDRLSNVHLATSQNDRVLLQRDDAREQLHNLKQLVAKMLDRLGQGAVKPDGE